jgi:prevent-host-death family protein
MRTRIDIGEVGNLFSKLTDEVEAGQEIIITRSGKPVLKLVKFEDLQTSIALGFASEELKEWVNLDWGQLDEEFNQLFKED